MTLAVGAPGGVAEAAGALLRVAGWEVLFSAVLFVLVLGLTRLLRDATPLLRHALWGLVLLRLVLPIDLSVPFSLWSLVGQAEVASSAETLLAEAWSAGGGSDVGWIADGSSSTAPDSRSRADFWLLLAAGVWALGTLAAGTRVVLKRRSYREVMRRARPVADDYVLAVARRWIRDFRIRRPVRIITSDEFGSPFTCGSFRPVIFIPDAVLTHEQPDLMESVLAHELAHVARWDDLLLEIQLFISVLYFFNPVAWASARRMRDESERICDGMVLANGSIPAITYGRNILTVLKLGVASEPSLIPALVSTKERMEMRLKSIKAGRSVRRANVLYSLPLAFVFGLFLLPMATGSVAKSNAVAARAVAPVEMQDVVLANPMPGARVTSAWGPTKNPFTGQEAHHRGIDLAGPAESKVHAAADGVVEVATTEYAGGENHGTVIVIRHGAGLKTFYSHLDVLFVKEGDRVSRGDRIGTQGSTGKVTGPHLHFEVWLDGEPVDPARFVADWKTVGESFRM